MKINSYDREFGLFGIVIMYFFITFFIPIEIFAFLLLQQQQQKKTIKKQNYFDQNLFREITYKLNI